jgi:hypothetical protein
MNNARLENWAVIGIGSNPYQSPEQKSIFLMGEVYGHCCYKDGEEVMTSLVMHADGREVITRNTKYLLGKANNNYKKWYNEILGKELDENDPFCDISNKTL